jgi:hypothetical protein
MYFHPHSIGIRYSLGIVAYQLNVARPKSVHLGTESAEMATAFIRQLGQDAYTVRVDNPRIQRSVQEMFGMIPSLESNYSTPADLGVYLFAPVAHVAQAREEAIAVACENAISYKSFFYPGNVHRTVFHYIAALKRNYSVTSAANLFAPKFVVLWAAAKMLERLDSALYFRLEDFAMCRLIEYGSMWRLSYIVVLFGRRKDLTDSAVPRRDPLLSSFSKVDRKGMIQKL